MNSKTFFALVLVLFLFACGGTPILPSAHNSSPPDTRSRAALGDLLTVTYTLRLENGSVADTTDTSLAKENHLKNYARGQFSFILGESGKVPGFDSAIIGMHQGDHREATIEPTEKELILAINKTHEVPRTVRINKHQIFPPRAFAKYFGIPPFIGASVENRSAFAFRYSVINITNDSIITQIIVRPGDTYQLPDYPWKSKVVAVIYDEILFEHVVDTTLNITTPLGLALVESARSKLVITYQPKLGMMINKSVDIAPGYSAPQQFIVIDVTNEDFKIQRFGLLTDKRLKFSVDLTALTEHVKDVKADRPKPLISVNGGGQAN